MTQAQQLAIALTAIDEAQCILQETLRPGTRNFLHRERAVRTALAVLVGANELVDDLRHAEEAEDAA